MEHPAGALLITEYTEPSTGNSKAVELYNGSGAAVDLGRYVLRLVVNGGSSVNNLPLGGMLADGATYVICNPNSAQTLLEVCDLTWASMTFNGDDTVVLLRDAVQVDALGDGQDPGNAWGTAVTTQNVTLQRKCSVTQGSTALAPPFDPAVEWDVVAGESVAGFGTWHCQGGGTSSSSVGSSSTSAVASSAGPSSSVGTTSSSAMASSAGASSSLGMSSSAAVVLLPITVIPPQAFESTDEAGRTATFAVRLPQAPTSDVTVPIGFSLSGEVSATPDMLTFTTANWSTQRMVTLTGLNDDAVDGPQTVQVRVGPASSGDARYQGATGAPFNIRNDDNDTAGISVSYPRGNRLIENGNSIAVRMRLRARPASDVTLIFSGSDSTEATLSTTMFTFTSSTWNVDQEVTVTPLDDLLRDGPQPLSIQFMGSVSLDAAWSGVVPPDIVLSVLDDELWELTSSADHNSRNPSLKGDGSRMAFASALRIGADGNGAALDLIIAEFSTGSMINATTACTTQGIDRAPVHAARADVVVFSSFCAELRQGGPGDSGTTDIYIWTPAGGVDRISVSPLGGYGGGGSSQGHSISSDGRTVAFTARVRYAAADTDNHDDIYFYDRVTQTFTLVTAGSQVAPGDVSKNFFIPDAAFGGGDRYFLYRTRSTGLVPSDTNNQVDAFLLDRQTGVTIRVSVNQNGTQTTGAVAAALSLDGQHVALVASLDGNGAGYYVKNLQTGVSTLLALRHQYDHYPEITINADGSRVLFLTRTGNLVLGDNNDAQDVFSWDRATNTLTRLSIGPQGQVAQNAQWAPMEISLAAEAPLAAFISATAYLGTGYSSLYYTGMDIFLARVP